MYTWGHLVVEQHNESASLYEFMDSIRSRSGYCLAGASWLGSVIFGFWILLVHNTDTGNPSLDEYGIRATLVRDHVDPIALCALKEFIPPEGELHVVMAVHPKCPCTRSTLAELERLLGTESTTTRCVFLVSMPSEMPMSWLDSGTTKLAMGIPNARIVVDVDAKRAQRLGLKNSGEILIVQPDGTVSFSGGITSGRTCSQENPGSVAVASLFRGDSIHAITTPTFGCPIK